MTATTSSPIVMVQEALQAADAIQAQTTRSAGQLAELTERLRRAPPRFAITCARGSSDHASLYGKYLIETHLGIPVASVGPSIASVYQRTMDLRDTLMIAVSQSGKSPDLLRLAETAKQGGALVVGFVNVEDSPLAKLCDVTIGLSAGPEQAIAATKSFITSAYAFLNLVAHWSKASSLLAATEATPDALRTACTLDWSPMLKSLHTASSLYVLGRGVGFGIAQEMALKFKETSCLHAEAFSAAEVVHGPLALIRNGFPVIALTQNDAAAENTREVLKRMISLGGRVAVAGDQIEGAVSLPSVPGVAPEIAPLCYAQSFYLAVPQLAQLRGLDPDRPDNLQKVTETV